MLVDAFKQAAPAIDAMGKQLGNIPTFVAPIAAAFGAMALSGLAPVIASIPVLGGMLGPLSGLLSALGGPVGIAIAAFAGLVAVSPPLQDALGNLMGALGELGNTLGPIFGAAIDAIVPVLNSIVDVLGGAFAAVVNGAADLIKQLADAITGLSTGGGFDAWLQSMQPVADFVMSILQPALDGLSTGAGLIVEAFSGFGEAVGGAFETLSPFIEQARDAISQFAAAIQPLIDVYLQNLGVYLQTVATIVSTVFGTAFQVAGAIVQVVMGTISGIIQTTVGVIQTVIGVFVGIFTGNWQMAANGAQTVFQGMSTTVTSIANGLSSALSAIVNGISSIFSSVFNGISTMVSNSFHGMADTIGNLMGDAKNTVSNGLNAIAGFFRNLKIPQFHIPVPELHISGGFSLVPPSVPHVSLSWHAKGAIFSEPYVFPGPGGLHGIGEAGPEAVAPISTLTGYISDAVNNSKSDDELISEISGLREDVRNMRVVMDGQTVGTIVSPYVDSNLGEYKVVANR